MIKRLRQLFSGRKCNYSVKLDKLTSLHLQMIAIPEGSFLMGATESETESRRDERPQHQVTVSSFFMSKYPITQSQWKAIASREDLKVKQSLNPKPSYFEGANRPVEQVSWYEVIEFCKRLSKLTKTEYRLPSESEWEYACRAGTNTPFYFGKTITTDLVNYDGNFIYKDEPKGQYRKETTPVGQFPPNAFGLYDMHGNVWEWCLDDWHDNYDGAPTNGIAWIDNPGEHSSFPVLRGGSWYNRPENCRSATRYNFVKREYHYLDIGFRVVCNP